MPPTVPERLAGSAAPPAPPMGERAGAGWRRTAGPPVGVAARRDKGERRMRTIRTRPGCAPGSVPEAGIGQDHGSQHGGHPGPARPCSVRFPESWPGSRRRPGDGGKVPGSPAATSRPECRIPARGARCRHASFEPPAGSYPAAPARRRSHCTGFTTPAGAGSRSARRMGSNRQATGRAPPTGRLVPGRGDEAVARARGTPRPLRPECGRARKPSGPLHFGGSRFPGVQSAPVRTPRGTRRLFRGEPGFGQRSTTRCGR